MTADIARFIWETGLIGKALIFGAALLFLVMFWLAMEARNSPTIEDDEQDVSGAYWHWGDR